MGLTVIPPCLKDSVPELLPVPDSLLGHWPVSPGWGTLRRQWVGRRPLQEEQKDSVSVPTAKNGINLVIIAIKIIMADPDGTPAAW